MLIYFDSLQWINYLRLLLSKRESTRLYYCQIASGILPAAVFLKRLGVSSLEVRRWTWRLKDLAEGSVPSTFNKIQHDIREICHSIEQEQLDRSHFFRSL